MEHFAKAAENLVASLDDDEEVIWQGFVCEDNRDPDVK